METEGTIKNRPFRGIGHKTQWIHTKTKHNSELKWWAICTQPKKTGINQGDREGWTVSVSYNTPVMLYCVKTNWYKNKKYIVLKKKN